MSEPSRRRIIIASWTTSEKLRYALGARVLFRVEMECHTPVGAAVVTVDGDRCYEPMGAHTRILTIGAVEHR